MADRKLNEVPVVNDISHLLGVRSNGEIIRISKENMASVLGGTVYQFEAMEITRS